MLGTINQDTRNKRKKAAKKEQGQAPSQSAINTSTEPLASSAINATTEPLASSAINASPEPWPRAQSPPHPSPGLERNQRLARASASAPGF